MTLDRDNTDLQVVNTTTETEILEYTVLGGTLIDDRGLRITLNGFHKNDSGGTVVYTYRIKLGATTLWSHTFSVADAGTVYNAPDALRADLMAKNSDAEQEVFGILSLGYQLAPTTGEGVIPVGGGITAELYGSATEDGTTDLVLAVTVQMDTAHASAEFTRRRWIIELL